MKFSRQDGIKSVLLFIFSFFLYANSLHVPFQFDDTVVIINNPHIHHLPDWAATIKGAFYFQASRALTLLTFAMNYAVHRLDVTGYHLINILVHMSAGLAVWWLGEILMKLSAVPSELETKLSRRRQKKAAAAAHKTKTAETASHPWGRHVPFLAALVFIAHPVNTQAVTYIAQRSEALAALFYVTSACCYLSARMNPPQATRYFSWAVLTAVLAMLSKETAITLPLTILFVEWFFFGRTFINSKILAAVGAGILIVPMLFRFDWGILTAVYPSQSHLGDVLTLPRYLLTQARVLMIFLRLVFVPVGLNLDYDLPMSHSFVDPPSTLLAFMAIAALLSAAVRWRKAHPMFAFAVFWFFLTLASNLIPRVHVIFEHKLYLALTGTIPALCLGLNRIFKSRRELAVGLAVSAIVLGVLTIERNNVWQSEISLWEDVVKKSPEKGRAHLSLGAAYASAKQYDLALKHLNKAAALMSDARVYEARGAVYGWKKNDGQALVDFNQAIAKDPYYVQGYLSRGELWAKRKNFQAAAEDFNQAIALDPKSGNAYKMRGRLNESFKRYDAALADYNTSITLEPADAQAVAWRGYIYALRGDKDAALADFEEALRLDPRFSDGYIYRGMARKDQGKFDEARMDFNRAISLGPSALGYYQRAQLEFQEKRFSDAVRDVNEALRLDSDYDLAYALRARLSVEQRQLKAGLSDLNQSIRINPEFYDAYVNRGLLNFTMGNTREAIADFSKAVELNPRSASAYNRRARAYASIKSYESSIADFGKAIALNPNAAADYYGRAMVYKETGDKASALADAKRAQELGYPVPAQFLKDLAP